MFRTFRNLVLAVDTTHSRRLNSSRLLWNTSPVFPNPFGAFNPSKSIWAEIYLSLRLSSSIIGPTKHLWNHHPKMYAVIQNETHVLTQKTSVAKCYAWVLAPSCTDRVKNVAKASAQGVSWHASKFNKLDASASCKCVTYFFLISRCCLISSCVVGFSYQFLIV